MSWKDVLMSGLFMIAGTDDLPQLRILSKTVQNSKISTRCYSNLTGNDCACLIYSVSRTCNDYGQFKIPQGSRSTIHCCRCLCSAYGGLWIQYILAWIRDVLLFSFSIFLWDKFTLKGCIRLIWTEYSSFISHIHSSVILYVTQHYLYVDEK